MLVPFTGQSFDDDAYGLPASRLINWHAEVAPERPNRGFRLLPTPGVNLFSGALRGLACTAIDVDDQTGRIFAHVGATVAFFGSRGEIVAQQSVTRSDAVSRISKSQTEIVIATGSQAFLVSEDAVSEITLPDGASGGVLDATESGQRHIYVENNSGRIWWSNVADAATIKADAFLTAEDEADNIRAVRSFQNSVFLFGARTIQVLRPSGSEDAPFYPSPGGTIPKGVTGRAAVTSADFGQFFVGDDSLVYRLNSYQAERISTNWIERRIKDVPTSKRPEILLTSYPWEGHTFVLLRLPDVGTWAWDAATGMWHRQQSYGQEISQRNTFFDLDGEVYVGMTDGRIGRLTRETTFELENTTVALAGSIIPIEDGRPVIRNAVVEAQAGTGPADEDVEIEMRLSPNGRSWYEWERGLIGRVGEYNRRTVFGPFGRFEPPLMGLELRYSGKTPLPINAVKLNQARP